MTRSPVPTSMRLAHDLKGALDCAAEANGRSVAGLTDIILRQWLEEKGFLPSPAHPIEREIALSGGNIRQGHISLYRDMDLIPADAMGGSNKSLKASSTVTVEFSPGQTVETDIDRGKKFFRVRGAVSDFFKQSGAKEGDHVLLSKIGSHSFKVILLPQKDGP